MGKKQELVPGGGEVGGAEEGGAKCLELELSKPLMIFLFVLLPHPPGLGSAPGSLEASV